MLSSKAPLQVPASPVLRVALIMEYPVRQKGGTEVLVVELAQRLSAKCQIVLVTPDPQDDLPPQLLNAIHSHVTLPLPHSKASGEALAANLSMLQMQIAHFHLGGTYTWKTRTALACPLLGCSRAGIPFLITNHGVFGFFGYCGKPRSLLVRFGLLPFFWISRLYLIAASRGEIMVSKNDLAKMRKWFFPVGYKLKSVYHSLLPDKPRHESAIRTKRFLCVGTIGSRKGQWLLTEAFALICEDIPEWRLTLVGRFSDEETRSKVMKPLFEPVAFSRVNFVEKATDAEVQNFYLTSEIFVMPSLEEGLGLTLQEALFYGCACISSRAGGTEDLVSDGDNGLLVARDNVMELASAMKRMANDASLRAKVMKRGPESIVEKSMSAEGMAARYVEIYQSILLPQDDSESKT